MAGRGYALKRGDVLDFAVRLVVHDGDVGVFGTRGLGLAGLSISEQDGIPISPCPVKIASLSYLRGTGRSNTPPHHFARGSWSNHSGQLSHLQFG